MDNYLIDRQILGQFADNLITQKYPSGAPADAKTREDIMSALDNRISTAVFGGLSDSGLIEMNNLLDDPATSADQFQDFFTRQGVDLERTITDTMTNFKTEYLGDYND